MIKHLYEAMKNPFIEEDEEDIEQEPEVYSPEDGEPLDEPISDDEEENDREVGIEIEHEHAPTLARIKEYFEASDGKWPSIDLVAEWIYDDHVNEHRRYYNSLTGLPAMEETLTQEEQENDTEEI